MDLPRKEITKEAILELTKDENAKRINFASSHKNALKRTDKEEAGSINLPFEDSINPVLKKETGCILFKSQFNDKYYRKINNNNEYICIKNFISAYKDIVFLRDNLDMSIALSMNYDGNDNSNRTEIGELEYQAKFCKNRDAEKKLIEKCKDWIKKLPFYKEADLICAIPSSDPNEDNLPKRVVEALTEFNFTDISRQVFWRSKTKSIKEANSVEEKLDILDDSLFTIAENTEIKGKTIVVFDDLYMSGITIQYVAMKLKEAGAQRILGLTIVKSRSNTAR